MNKKGFTLVELLAVMIILSVILLIAVPNILNIIEDSRLKSFRIKVETVFNSIRNEQSINNEISGNISDLKTLNAKEITGTWKIEDEIIYICDVENDNYKVVVDSDNCISEEEEFEIIDK